MNEEEKEEFWQDLGRPEDQPLECAFTVVVSLDGKINTEVFPQSDKVKKAASTFDIYQACKEIVSDIESHLLADRVARLVLEKLQPKNAADEIREKIINALNDRKQ